jgi:hypothetical protein
LPGWVGAGRGRWTKSSRVEVCRLEPTWSKPGWAELVGPRRPPRRSSWAWRGRVSRGSARPGGPLGWGRASQRMQAKLGQFAGSGRASRASLAGKCQAKSGQSAGWGGPGRGMPGRAGSASAGSVRRAGNVRSSWGQMVGVGLGAPGGYARPLGQPAGSGWARPLASGRSARRARPRPPSRARSALSG